MRALVVVVASLLAACGGQDAESGVEALIQVQDAQFTRGNLPEPSAGPAVKGLSSRNNRVFPGLRNQNLSGRVEDRARAVLIQLAGDAGFWTVPTGVVDATEVGQRTFDARVTFSSRVPIGMQTINVVAVDAAGQIGAANDFVFAVQDPTPQALFVIALDWDADADLDLRVTMPSPTPTEAEPTIELSPRRPSAYRRTPGVELDPASLAAAPHIDVDSNASCVIDGRRRENLIATQAPPRGHYAVRVDTAGLCGVSAARWRVRVVVAGEVVRELRGIASPSDGYPAQGADLEFGKDLRPGTAGAGVLVDEFDL